MQIIFMFFISVLIGSALAYGNSKNSGVDEDLGSAVVLMYHRFSNAKYPSTNIRLEQFEQHLKYIQESDFNVWPLSKILIYILGNKKIPQKTVVITIDDAYISTYTYAYPRLKAKKFPFTVFVSTRAVDSNSKNYMNWDEMREMRLNGAEFANHSLTHEYLLPRKFETNEDWKKRFKNELYGAQKRLQEELGVSTNSNPKLFSYPFGEYDKETKILLKELDYVGVTQTSGVLSANSDLRMVPRFAMAEAYADKKGFILKINTIPLEIESLSPIEPLVTLQNPPVLNIKLKKPIKNIGCYRANGKKITIKYLSKTKLQVEAKSKLKAPRDRYTCTAPSKDGRWHWHSKLWIIKN